MPTIHVHHPDGSEYTYATVSAAFVDRMMRTRVRDVGSLRTMYADLERRMALCLIDTMSRARTGDDLAAGNEHGHQFYGNQHTGGIGGPAKHEHVSSVHLALATKKIKSAKMAVHALLVSGHPFSKEELAEAVGMDPKGKTINDYLTNLKNPKFAGPQGALKIEKNAQGHFYVAMPDGSQAPPPDTKLDLSKGHDPTTAAAMQKLTDTPNAFKPAAVPVDKTPEWMKKDLQEEDEDPNLQMPPEHTVVPDKGGMPDWETVKLNEPLPEPVHSPYVTEVSYDPVQHDSGVSAFAKMQAAAPGSMSKTEADKHYANHMDAAFDQLKGELDDGDIDPHTAVLSFKNEKAHGMAAWAQAVHGHAFKPTPQQVFKADLALTQALIGGGAGASKAHALEEWKKNTAGEKAGIWPPKPAAPAVAAKTVAKPTPKAMPAPVSPSADAMPAAVPVAPIDYHKMRPKGFVDIDEDDIMSGKFKKGILSLKKQLVKESGTAAANKKTVEERLRERLKDAPNFQALRKRFGHMPESGLGSLESKLVQTWASSSGDGDELSVAMQMAVRDAFTIPDDHIEKKALHALETHGHDVDKLTIAGMHKLAGYTGPKLTAAEAKTARAALQEFVHAQYNETQEHLKALGHDHVFIVRGMKYAVKHDYTAPAAVKLQPASSFSADWETSRGGFTGGGYGTMFITKVPREQVLSTYITGFGCTGEHEVVVLAHEKMKAYTMPAQSHVSSSATSAQAYMQQALKAANPQLKVTQPKIDEQEY